MYTYYSPVQLPAAIELTKLMRLPFQEIGNCAWANSEAVIYALLVLESVRCNAKLHVSKRITFEEICKKQKVLFDTLQAFIIDSEIKKYTESHTKLTRVVAELYKSYYPPDPRLLGR